MALDLYIDLDYGTPLINMKGEVIGMNMDTSKWQIEQPNHGYIVPSNTIKKVVPSMIATGFVEHPWMGIIGNNTSRESGGVVIASIIHGGPAEKAGMQSRDIIVKIDNIPVVTMDDILNYIQKQKHVGDTLNLSMLRDGQAKSLILHLAPRPHLQFLA